MRRPDINGRHPLNVPGKYFVDDQCLDCDLCRETAPGIFARDDLSRSSYVIRQPVTEAEHEACREAMAGCCTEAIADTGDRYDWATLPAVPSPAS